MKNVKNDTENCKVKIIPLGGLEQIGMNMTAIEYGDSIIVMDCGLAFPSDDMLGIDLVIPDVTYLKDNYEKVKGFVITHGHEDHIGALPYVLKMVNAPVYATKLTMGLIDHKLEENNMLRSVKRKVVKRTVHQSRLLPRGIYQDEPLDRGRGCSCCIYTGGNHLKYR